MSSDLPDLTALVGSRICHDLISPLGAIGNGVELLTMSGTPMSPEIALISDSVSNANARIRFFRIAFGAVSPGQGLPMSEVRSILSDMTRGGRLSIDWPGAGDLPRADVRMAFLALQCLETAMPFGWRVTVTSENGAVTVVADAAKMKIDAALWDRLSGPVPAAEVTAAHVQFALLPLDAARRGRHLTVTTTENRIVMSF